MSLTGVEEKLSADLGIYSFQTVTHGTRRKMAVQIDKDMADA